MISRTEEKSNQNVNLRMMRSFWVVIDDLHLKELPLIGCRFTWSNERINATHTKIDKVLFTDEWEAIFSDYQVLAGSTEISDHCPLILKKFSSQPSQAFALRLGGLPSLPSRMSWLKLGVNQFDPMTAFGASTLN